MTAGAVAAGSPLTVEAGLAALRKGGNAVDAAVAASVMAGVAEPLLTGLGGAGMGIVRMDGEVRTLDLFSDVPGLGRPGGARASLERVDVDFGPAVQTFHVGAGAAAVPGLPGGLELLHRTHGRVPMPDLLEPAARAAEAGVPVTRGFEQVASLLWPILKRDPSVRALFEREGRSVREGDTFRNPELGGTIRRFAQHGAQLFQDGALGDAMLGALGPVGALTRGDLTAWEPRFADPIRYRYRDATVWLPGPSSVGGLLVAQALRALEDHGPMPEPFGAGQVRFLAHALRRADRTRGPRLHDHLHEPGFMAGFLAALAPEEEDEARAHGGRQGRGEAPPREPGNTTHISVVDSDGNAVGLTHSLGETCGLMVPGTGLFLNNFLGESDVFPPDADLRPGQRLMTMCCPTILEVGGNTYVMGSGGSSRIRSAVLHGVVYLTDHGLDAAQAVAAPRCHVEGGQLYAETADRPPGALEALAAGNPGMRRFEGRNMFFGGLHMVGVGPAGFSGAGDARRSGTFGVTD